MACTQYIYVGFVGSKIFNSVKSMLNYLTPLFLTIESVDSISRDERDAPLTQYIANAGITRARYNIMHFKHHHRVLQPNSNRLSV